MSLILINRCDKIVIDKKGGGDVMKHYTYIVKCVDDTLYTGYTTDLTRRVHEHNHTKKGARYTSSRRPVTLVYQESFDTKSEAYKREAQIKKLTKIKKLDLINQTQKKQQPSA